MYRIWYWAVVGRENDGRFIASIPDLEDLAAWGGNEKDAVAHVTELAAKHVRGLVAGGQPIPRPRSASQMPNFPQANKIGRAMVSVQIGRIEAGPAPLAPSECAQDGGTPYGLCGRSR
jgi:predicted RNase H-like HicB family nuclease